MLACMTVFTGCDEQLEEQLYSSFGEGNFPTEATVETMITENYDRFGTLIVFNHRMGWATEMPTPSMQYQFRRNHVRNNLSSWTWNNDFGDPAYFDIMDFIWSSVRQSNDIIGLVPGIEMSNKQRQAEIVGEAKFLRGLVYFYAVRLWGGMPIIDKAQTLNDDLYPVRASISDTYAFIVQDFKDAIEVLPTRSQFASRGIPEGHATKGAAQALLAKVYLTMAGDPLGDGSHLQEAKTLLESVMNSSDYSLVQASGGRTAYEVLWDTQNENNSEMMFVIQKEEAVKNYRGMFGYFTPPFRTSGVYTSGASDAYSSGSALDGIPPEFAKWYASHDSGPRYQWTIITDLVATNTYDGKPAGTSHNMEDGPNHQAYIGKYRAVGEELVSNFFCPNDFPVLRYADVLLMHSEVTNELGTADYTGVNATRQRAGLAPLSGLSKDAFRDAVFLERDLELTYEQQMLFDMRRRGFEYCKSKLEGFFKPGQNSYQLDFSTIKLEPHRLLYPYPPRELAANPNLAQNPGYPQ